MDEVDGFDLLDDDDEEEIQVVSSVPLAKRARRVESKLCLAAASIMSSAHDAFFAHKLSEAWELCKDAIRIDSAVHEPYLLMTCIAKERGEGGSALVAELTYLSCIYNPTVTALQWVEAAESTSNAARKIECLGHAITLDPQSMETRGKRVARLGQSQLVLCDLRFMWRHRVLDVSAHLARVCLQLGLAEEGLLSLRSMGDLCFEDVGLLAMLTELYLIAGRVRDAANVLQRCKEPSSLITALRGVVAAVAGDWEAARKLWSSVVLEGRAALVVARVLVGVNNEEAAELLKHCDEESFCEAEHLKALLFEQRGELDKMLGVVRDLLQRKMLVAGMQELLLRHINEPRVKDLCHSLSELSESVLFERNEEERTNSRKKAKSSEKELTKGAVVAAVEDEDGNNLQHIGGWRHAVPAIGCDDLEVISDLTPKSFYQRVNDLFEKGKVRELLHLTAPVLETDLSRRLRHGNRGKGRKTRSGDMTYLANELGEPKYIILFEKVLRSLAHEGNTQDVGRFLDELCRMRIQKSEVCRFLFRVALSIGWPYLESQLPLAMKQLRSVVVSERESSFYWWHFARLGSGRVDLYRTFHNFIETNSKLAKPSFQSLLLMGYLLTVRSRPAAALAFFERAVKQTEGNDPVAVLSLASCLLNLAQFGSSSQDNVLKGFALLFSLKKKLNDSSWWLFNLARGYHHVGMMTEAAHFYVKCLETRNTEKVTEDADTRERNAVEREAAFNLHLIYKKSGNSLAAIKVLQEYLTF